MMTPETLRSEADRNEQQAAREYESSEYPRVGRAAYIGLAAANRNLAETIERTDEMKAQASAEANPREKRRLMRVARLERRAAAYERMANQAWTASHNATSGIPFGQPILVGHHSERRHRRAIERAQRMATRGMNLNAAAKRAREKAIAAAGNDAIYAHDSDAAEQLKEKIAKLENEQTRMKAVNAAFRKGDAAMRKLGLTDGYIQELKDRVASGYSWEKQPFPGYSLQNNNANIRRLKMRLKSIEAMNARPAPVDRELAPGIKLSFDESLGRYELRFPGKPAIEICTSLKRFNWRWAPSVGAWVTNRTPNADWRLKELEKLFAA